jgi:hypothetical protein
MADLRSLMQVAPTTGGFFTGQQVAQERETEALRQRELESIIAKRLADMQYDQQANPLKLAGEQLKNQGMEADNLLKTTSATKAAGTLDSDIAAGNAGNKSKILKAQAEEAIHFSGILKEGVMQTQKMNPMERTAYMRKLFEHNKMNPDDPQLQQLMQMDPQQLMSVSEQIARSSADYIKTIDKEKIQQAGAMARQQSSNQTQLDLEDKRINAGKYDRNKTATTVANMLLKARDPIQKAEILETAFHEAEAANDMKAAAVYKQRALEARQRAAEDAQNRGLAIPRTDKEAMGIPQTAAPGARAPIAGGGAPAPQPPQGGRVSVVSPDGKRGSIPADQLDAAIKQGYKRAQ